MLFAAGLNKAIPNSVESLFTDLEDTRNTIKAFKEREEEIKKLILENYAKKIVSSYKEKGEPFGAASFKEEFGKITFTTPKKVKWNQDGLKKLYAEGAPVDVEFSVSETEFKNQDDAGKAAFMKYRTVEPGSVTIKVDFNV